MDLQTQAIANLEQLLVEKLSARHQSAIDSLKQNQEQVASAREKFVNEWAKLTVLTEKKARIENLLPIIESNIQYFTDKPHFYTSEEIERDKRALVTELRKVEILSEQIFQTKYEIEQLEATMCEHTDKVMQDEYRVECFKKEIAPIEKALKLLKGEL